MAATELQGPLSVIALAVTPVVMISATAILIGSVSTKHSSMADRVRALTSEYRQQGTSAGRRRSIEEQCRLFQRRLTLVRRAHVSLYVATGFFVSMVMAIGISSRTSASLSVIYPLFVAGTMALGYGVMMEVWELRLANRTLQLEVADAMGQPYLP